MEERNVCVDTRKQLCKTVTKGTLPLGTEQRKENVKKQLLSRDRMKEFDTRDCMRKFAARGNTRKVTT